MTSKKFRRQSGSTDVDVMFSHFTQSSPVKVIHFHFLHQKFYFKICSCSEGSTNTLNSSANLTSRDRMWIFVLFEGKYNRSEI